MPMQDAIIKSIASAIRAMGAEPPEVIEVEVPRQESHGDLASPVALGLARALKKSPRAIADEIVANLPERRMFERVEVAGPGFINFTFSRAYMHDQVRAILRHDPSALRRDVGKGRRIQVEFVSANPTGPLHLGHGRGAALGCALSNILKAAGYDVQREYYVNDAGRQVKLLGESVYARYKGLLGIECPVPDGGYMGEYVEDVAREVQSKEGARFKDAPYADCESYFVDFALDRMLKLIKEDLGAFNVHFDVWQSERALYENKAVQHAIEFLRGKGLIYEHEGATWFRAMEFGDDKDRVVIKADGAPTYFASDIAYHLNKVERGFDEVINIWGADHHGYVPRLEAVMDALGAGREKLKVLLVQMVSLMRSGVPVQMSKRTGEFVTLKELIDEVGGDTTKFIFLTRRHDSQLAFDLDAAKAQSAENPVFYVQYANARINSIFLKASSEGADTGAMETVDLSPLVEEEEVRLIRKMLTYRDVFAQSAELREPHRITFYLQELAGQFHPYYNKHRVVGEAPELTRARLAICQAVREVIKDGLTLLGLTAPDRM